MDDEDVDVYFAKHDIQSVVSDILYELGYHRPEELGPFLANYVERRFGETNIKRRAGSSICSVLKGCDAVMVESGGRQPSSEELAAGQMLLEIRQLRRKYLSFAPQAAGNSHAASFTAIAWKEFEGDYERLLQLLGSSALWNFCRRRLAAARGLFEAHRALNEDNEDEEAAGRGLTRVDNCIQLARALPPGRLMDVFHSKLAEGNGKDEDAGALRKLLEGRDAGGWQRPPGPQELTADADEPVPAMQSLKGLFSCTTNVVHGSYLRETTAALLRRLERSSHASGGVTLAELRLPLHAEGDAWVDLARWASDLGSLSSRACWVVQLHVTSYAALKGRRAILDYGELLDNAFGPLVKLVTEEPHGEVWLKLQELLHHVVAFELSACLAVTEPLNGEVPEPSEWNESHSPPLAYQFYHLWARLKGLNCARARSKQKELGLRAAASSPEALACAYLLGASSVSGCGSLSSHLPLQYLYMLDQVGVAVSQCSKRSLGEAGALQKLFTHGLRVALCTEDPAVSHWSDDPLGQEYGLAHSAGFSNADLAELARNSQWISSFESFAREEENVEEQEAMGLRARYRRAQRQEEIEFLSSLIPDKDQNHL